jgi:hypothetical protein
MSCTQGGGSSTHFKCLNYNDYILEQHNDDIHREHDYNHGEHDLEYMPSGPANIYVLQLQNKHRLEEVFTGIIRIFIFNLLKIKGIIYLCIYILNCYTG